MKRREFIQKAGAAGLCLTASTFPLVARAANYNVIVVGGGMAGATVAKYLRMWSNRTLSVLLIEKDTNYTSNIMSNEVLTGKRASISSLQYSYSNLVSNWGITLQKGTVTAIDTAALEVSVSTSSGAFTYSCDRLVLAPGLDFDLMPGMSNSTEYDTYIPHAWKAGAQTTLLRSQLLGMANGDNVIITIPLAPYRCPPGPYERACVIADWLRTTGRTASKVIVLDENAAIQAQATNFTNAFNGAYGYTVDYRSGCVVTNITGISEALKTVVYTQGGSSYSESAKVLNPIPPQRAPALLADHGLLSGRFASVYRNTFESSLKPNIYVIGDASNSGVPKAGHIGNQEAKTCANAIVNALKGSSYAIAESSPVLNSACYTPVTSTMATWLSAVYQYSGGAYVASTQNGKTQPLAAQSASADNYSDMNKWFSTLMGDTFS